MNSLYIVLSILLFCILASMFMNNNKHSIVFIFDIVCSIIVLFIIIWLFLKKKSNEHFDTNTVNLDKILSIIGVQNNTSLTMSEVTSNIINSNYNEDLSNINLGLTLFYSAFSTNSYPSSSKIWYNMSTYFANPQNACPDVQQSDTNMTFTQTPSYSRENGFGIGNNSITGPKSHKTGLSGNSSYTIFFMMNFKSFNDNTNNYEILKLFGNTINNNGLALFINKDSVASIASTFAVNITINIGTQSIQCTDPSTGLYTIIINPNHTYMFAFIKNDNSLSFIMYPNIDNLTSNAQTRLILMDNQTISNEDVLFSNKEFVINRFLNIQGSLYTFGTFNRALDENSITLLYLHMQSELQKTSQILQNLATQIQALQNKIDLSKSCPYDSTVCTPCSSVKDWTNMNNVILNGNSNCLTSINNFCNTNPENDLCVCWNDNNLMSKTVQCQNYVNIFNTTKSFTAENIDHETLLQIKEKQNLCDCGDIDKISQMLSKQITKPKPIDNRPNIVLDASKYEANPDDITLYNSGGITNFYGSPAALSNQNISNNTSSSQSFWKQLLGIF